MLFAHRRTKSSLFLLSSLPPRWHPKECSRDEEQGSMQLFGVRGGEEENQWHSKDPAISSAACERDAVQMSGGRGSKNGGRCPEDKESSWGLAWNSSLDQWSETCSPTHPTQESFRYDVGFASCPIWILTQPGLWWVLDFTKTDQCLAPNSINRWGY